MQLSYKLNNRINSNNANNNDDFNYNNSDIYSDDNDNDKIVWHQCKIIMN